MSDDPRLKQKQVLVALVRRADEGDQQALAQVKALCAKVPDFWEKVSFTWSVKRQLMVAVTGEKELHLAALEHELNSLSSRLAGPDPTPLEEVLAERCAICWLAAQHADGIAARFLGKGGSLAQGDFYRRWQDSAHRRFLAACKTLAQVRRLALPVLQAQINVAQQQVVTQAPPEEGRS